MFVGGGLCWTLLSVEVGGEHDQSLGCGEIINEFTLFSFLISLSGEVIRLIPGAMMDNFDGHASRGMPHFHFRQLPEGGKRRNPQHRGLPRFAHRATYTRLKSEANRVPPCEYSRTPDDETEVIPIECVVRDIYLSVALFNFLFDSGRLPETDGVRGRIVYQLESNQLVISVVPSYCHDCAAAAFHY